TGGRVEAIVADRLTVTRNRLSGTSLAISFRSGGTGSLTSNIVTDSEYPDESAITISHGHVTLEQIRVHGARSWGIELHLARFKAIGNSLRSNEGGGLYVDGGRGKLQGGSIDRKSVV